MFRMYRYEQRIHFMLFRVQFWERIDQLENVCSKITIKILQAYQRIEIEHVGCNRSFRRAKKFKKSKESTLRM